MNGRRLRAIFRKEMREFRRNKQIISTMTLSPIGFVAFPVIFLFSINVSDVSTLYSYPVQVFMLAAVSVLPAVVGAYSIVGEREQGTLEPLLSTPIQTEELVLGKALAIFVPAASWSYLIFGVVDGLVWLVKPAAVSTVALRPSILLTQLVFTPLLACMAIWLTMAISAHTRDVRVAQQLAVLANVPVIIPLVLTGVHVIQLTAPLAIELGLVLLVLDIAGWPLLSKTLNREHLILATPLRLRLRYAHWPDLLSS
jgi:ABC-type transport system involved in multi-copper enzyme maturation permease subunit